MSFLERIFKKKDDDLGLPPSPEPYAYPQGQQEPYPQFNSGFPEQQPAPQQFSPEALGYERVTTPSYPQAQQQSASDIALLKDLELINAKLDAIKAELDSVNQRLRRIERLAEEPEQPAPRKDVWQY